MPGADEDGRADTAGAAQAEPEDRRGTLLITEPVRSGQRVFADSGDLVVVASVGSGAELIAVGNIHVYGSLRGRATAGVNGALAARILCTNLVAALITFAGLHNNTSEPGTPPPP